MKNILVLVLHIIWATEIDPQCDVGGDSNGQNLYIVTCDADGRWRTVARFDRKPSWSDFDLSKNNGNYGKSHFRSPGFSVKCYSFSFWFLKDKSVIFSKKNFYTFIVRGIFGTRNECPPAGNALAQALTFIVNPPPPLLFFLFIYSFLLSSSFFYLLPINCFSF